MPSACDSLRAVGFTVLGVVDSETLTFRGTPLNAVVDHDPSKNAANAGEVNFSLLSMQVVEFKRTVLPTHPTLGAVGPQLGEIFTDTAGGKLRIVLIRNTPDTFQCFCETPDA